MLTGSELNYSKDGTVAEVVDPDPRQRQRRRSPRTRSTTIRNDVIPATIGSVDGVTVNVSGNAAASKDFRDLLNARLPLIFAFVFALAFLLLLSRSARS